MIKEKFVVLLILQLSIISFNYVKADSSLPLLDRVIYLDPGHGGKDPGAMYKDIKESDINLEITLELEKELSKMGAIVYLTRDGDYDLSTSEYNRKRNDLSRKAALINNSDAELYLTIHLNSVNSSTWYGAQVFYDDINSKNVEIANIMQEELKRTLKTNRKYKEIKDIYLNRHVKVPGVLIEAGFLSNPNERYLLQNENYQKKLAKSIANATVKCFDKLL